MYNTVMKYVFIALCTALVTGIISYFTAKQKPDFLDESSGRLTPGKTSAWITIIGGLLMVALGLWMIFSILLFEQDKAGLSGAILLSLMGLAIAGFMSPSLFSIHDIVWDDDGVEGASSMFGPTLGWKRHKIKWNEIVKRGETVTQYWYLETEDKRRVYWSYLYSGYGELDYVISERCRTLNR